MAEAGAGVNSTVPLATSPLTQETKALNQPKEPEHQEHTQENDSKLQGSQDKYTKSKGLALWPVHLKSGSLLNTHSATQCSLVFYAI